MHSFLIEQTVLYNPVERTLTRRDSKQAEPIYLTNKENMMLHQLTQGVSLKSSLIESVWPEKRGFISDSSFYKTVHMLRKSLQDAGLNKEIIKTRSGYGLIFSASLQQIELLDTQVEVDKTVIPEQISETQTDSETMSTSPIWRNKETLLKLLIICPAIGSFYLLNSIFSFQPERLIEWKEFQKTEQTTLYTLSGNKVNTEKILAELKPLLPNLNQPGSYFISESEFINTVIYCQERNEDLSCQSFLSFMP